MKKPRYRLKVESFRRLLKTFQGMTGSHHLGWVLANDAYEMLLGRQLEPTGRTLNQGPKFNQVRGWWSLLIKPDYPDTRQRAKLAYDLVTKLIYMFKHGNLRYVGRKHG